MNVLGINCVFHESAAALLVDGKLAAACEEERFTRVKHAKQAAVDNPHQLPEHAIRFCLNAAGLGAADIDHVAYSFDPRLRSATFRAEWWPDPQMEAVFLEDAANCRELTRDEWSRRSLITKISERILLPLRPLL